MGAVTKEFLIKSMYTWPTNDRETGFNAALILILKELADVSDVKLSDADILKSVCIKLSNVHYVDFEPLAISVLFGYIRSNSKLQGVKYFREITGMGLKESKDHIDEIAKIIIQ